MKTVIEMAREVYGVNTEWTGAPLERLTQFAELVRAEEREACAEVVEAIQKRCIAKDVDDPPLEHVAAAIRARGNT